MIFARQIMTSSLHVCKVTVNCLKFRRFLGMTAGEVLYNLDTLAILHVKI